MIKLGDLYNVLSAVVPLYVAMILAYGSVRWWRILTPEQCGGINRFVAIFAVPLLSFEIVSGNNPYKMNLKFVLADGLQKVIILAALAIWARISSARQRAAPMDSSSSGSATSSRLDWVITLFMLSTLPNTLVMGVPLLAAMYGRYPGSLVVQAVVLQCVIWYTLLLFLYEYRAARILIREQFPDTAASIVSFKVDSDVISLDGRDPVQADAEVGDDGKIHVVVRRSVSLSSPPHRRSSRAAAGITPRASNLTGAEIYSMHSSRNLSPRHSNYGGGAANTRDDLLLLQRPSNFTNADVYSLHSSRAPTPRTSNFNDAAGAPLPPWLNNSPHHHGAAANGNGSGNQQDHMFVWSSSNSPVSHPLHQAAAAAAAAARHHQQSAPARFDDNRNEFSFGNPVISFRDDSILPPADKEACPSLTKMGSTSSTTELAPKAGQHIDMPPARVMTKLILNMVWRKLIRNPNTYSSLIAVVWALISYRWNLKMPAIVDKSITILSSAGLGMAMFSLGLFMALQKRLLACGTPLTCYGMLVRFVTGPAVMAAASIAVGLRGVDLKVSIVQAALPQGIVPFVFAKEYNVHPDILSTAVIFGMLVAFPITLLYYVLLGL